MSNSSEHEWESESENEFESFGEGELENESEAYSSHSGQGEGEAEGEAFFRQLVQLAQRASRSPALQKIAKDAARAALNAIQGSRESEFEGEAEFSGFDDESDAETWVLDQMMEQLGYNAANAQSEDEAAEAFLPLIPLVAAKLLPLAAKAIPLASKVAPKLISTVMRSAPQLNNAIKGVTKTLFRKRGGRQLVRTVPTMVRRTAMSMAKQVAQGKPVTPQAAVRTFAAQANKVLANPQQAVRAMSRSRKLTCNKSAAARPVVAQTKPQTCSCGDR